MLSNQSYSLAELVKACQFFTPLGYGRCFSLNLSCLVNSCQQQLHQLGKAKAETVILHTHLYPAPERDRGPELTGVLCTLQTLSTAGSSVCAPTTVHSV